MPDLEKSTHPGKADQHQAIECSYKQFEKSDKSLTKGQCFVNG
jgi:hypothetical protein